MHDISKYDNFVQQNELRQVNGGLLGLLLGYGEEEFLFLLFEVEGDQILWSLYEIVNLVVCGILDNEPIIKVQIIVEAKDVHCAIVNKICLIALIFKLLFYFIVVDSVPIFVVSVLLSIVIHATTLRIAFVIDVSLVLLHENFVCLVFARRVFSFGILVQSLAESNTLLIKLAIKVLQGLHILFFALATSLCTHSKNGLLTNTFHIDQS